MELIIILKRPLTLGEMNERGKFLVELLYMLSWRYLLDIQVVMSSWKLDYKARTWAEVMAGNIDFDIVSL